MQTLLRGENDSKQLDEIQAKVAHGLYKGVPLPGFKSYASDYDSDSDSITSENQL